MLWGQTGSVPVPAVSFWMAVLLGLALAAVGVRRMRGSRPRNVWMVGVIAMLVPVTAWAIPFTFTNGTVADANQVNANFAALAPTRTLTSDAKSFSLPPNPNQAFELDVPAGVVLTDVVLSLNAPSLVTTVFVSDMANSKTYFYEAVGSGTTTFAANNNGHTALSLQSGLTSSVGLRIGVTCNNVGGNSCSGALMWSGYTP
jgi:hypothetical protein